MPDRPPQSFRSALEQQILQRFCTEDLPESVTAAIKTKLDSYAWCDPDNRIVFEAAGSRDKTFKTMVGATHYYAGQPELLSNVTLLTREWLRIRGLIEM